MKFTTIILVLAATCTCTEEVYQAHTFAPFGAPYYNPIAGLTGYRLVGPQPYQVESMNEPIITLPKIVYRKNFFKDIWNKVVGNNSKSLDYQESEKLANQILSGKNPAEVALSKGLTNEQAEQFAEEYLKGNGAASVAINSTSSSSQNSNSRNDSTLLNNQNEEELNDEEDVSRKFHPIMKEIKFMQQTLNQNVGQPLAHVQEKLNIYSQLVNSFKLTARTLQRKNKKARKATNSGSK